MTLALTQDDVLATRAVLATMLAEHEALGYWDWADRDSWARYADVLRYAGEHVVLTDAGALRVSVPATSDGRLWSHVAAEAIDATMSARHDGGYIRTGTVWVEYIGATEAEAEGMRLAYVHSRADAV